MKPLILKPPDSLLLSRISWPGTGCWFDIYLLFLPQIPDLNRYGVFWCSWRSDWGTVWTGISFFLSILEDGDPPRYAIIAAADVLFLGMLVSVIWCAFAFCLHCWRFCSAFVFRYRRYTLDPALLTESENMRMHLNTLLVFAEELHETKWHGLRLTTWDAIEKTKNASFRAKNS